VNAATLTLSQVRYVSKAFWRNPASAFFTFAFPLMFLVIFTSLLGHFTVHLGTRLVNTSTYYVASMAAFAVISACYTNIAIRSAQRLSQSVTTMRRKCRSLTSVKRLASSMLSCRKDPADSIAEGGLPTTQIR
jgi:hypothetical protein